MRLLVVAVLASACSSSAEGSVTDASAETSEDGSIVDTGHDVPAFDASADGSATCPSVASACPSSCFGSSGWHVRSSQHCVEPVKVFGCTDIEAGCEATITCLVRDDTHEVYWAADDCRLGAPWRACTSAEAAVVPFDGSDKYLCP